MDRQYCCLDCDWPGNANRQGCWGTALKHFVSTGHGVVAVATDGDRHYQF